MIIILVTGCSGSSSKTDSNPSISSNSIDNNIEVFRKKTLEEINFVRTNPSGYAEARLKSYYAKGLDNGAYNDIKSKSPVGKLELQSQLCSAASKYAKYLADHNVFGHEENGTPPQRCAAEGYHYFSGENIAAANHLNAETDPENAAIEFLIWLIIDPGVPDLGHRKNIMLSKHRKLGVGFARNPSSKVVNFTVQDFGSL